MPNPATPQALYGLHKAQSIGPDPTGEAITQMKTRQMQAALPNPENRGATAIDGLLKLGREYAGPVQETLGEMNPFHTPVGGEGMYNIARAKPNMAPSVEDSIYQNMMNKFGMGRK